MGDGTPLCGEGTEADRFVVNEDEVCDNTTGLFWQQTPGDPTDGTCGKNTECTWQQAVDYCVALGGGYRLPEVKELSSLVDYSQVGPALPAGHLFMNAQSEFYWSATTFANNPSDAWNVGFSNCNVDTGLKTFSIPFVWCVRSGS